MSAPSRDEAGIAVISALMLIFIMATLSVTAVRISLHSLDTTAVDRKRVQSVGAAEAGLDLGISQVSLATLPCTISGSLGTGPTTASYSVTVSYYSTYPVSGAPMTCTPGVGPSGTPAAAEITADGSTNAKTGGKRTMQALVRLNPVLSPALDKAIFSNAVFTPNNNVTVYGNVGNDAVVYTNGNFTCNNNETIQGSVYAQGTLSANNNCTVQVDYWSKGNATGNNNVTIGHDMKSSQGNITLVNNGKVNHDAIAHGTNTGGTVVNNRISNATLADPPYQFFPTVNFDAAAWTAAGYTRQINDGSNCAQVYTDINAMSTQTTPTVIRTTCALTWNNNNTIRLNSDLAVFSTGGFTANNNFTVQSTNSTVRNIHFIVPRDAVVNMPCSGASPGISLNNNTTFASTVRDFLYTPCTITINNNDGGYGQIYGGTVAVNNNFTLHYKSVPVPGAYISGATPSGYSQDIIYKREVK